MDTIDTIDIYIYYTIIYIYIHHISHISAHCICFYRIIYGLCVKIPISPGHSHKIADCHGCPSAVVGNMGKCWENVGKIIDHHLILTARETTYLVVGLGPLG